MNTNDNDRRLLFMRRMIWWLPILVFAVFAAFYVGVRGLTPDYSFFNAIINALIPAVIVGILCLALYFGYRYYITRTPGT